MPNYSAPHEDMLFAIRYIAGLEAKGDFTESDLEAILEAAADFTGGVLSPLNTKGDRHPAKLEDGIVHTSPGFKDAYENFTADGWNGMPFDSARGGMNLPWLVTLAVQEMVASANLSFSLCPLLTQGSIEALTHHGSPDQKKLYLDKLISGEWSGTMNLTEPQAGSDLAQVRTQAIPNGDHYVLKGEKIFTTYGDHNMTGNIVHLVLARTPNAPPGVKGISLFVAPKYLVNEDGSLGARNDVVCARLEEKFGIHASPTCAMVFGSQEGAKAWLIGQENHGLEYMFTMMNNARLSVGVQGVGMAQRAYQAADDYAQTRVQGKPALGGETISGHPDVLRMLLDMRAKTEAARGLAYIAGAALDKAATGNTAAQTRVELLTPIVKAWCTDIACEVASIGMQVHGGIGYIEETGAGQYFRDARITPIYEGTNGIQALDLAGRKTARDQGRAAKDFIDEMRAVAAEATRAPEKEIASMGCALHKGIKALDRTVDWVVKQSQVAPVETSAGAHSYLQLFALVAGGFVMTKSALAARNEDAGTPKFRRTKLATAQYYAQVLMPHAEALSAAAMNTYESVKAAYIPLADLMDLPSTGQAARPAL